MAGNIVNVKTHTVDPTSSNIATVNEEGRQDVVQHSHPNSVDIHFHANGLDGTHRYILIDISDTTNYKHALTNYIHIENLFIEVDSSQAATYILTLLFLENVDDANGDAYSFFHLSGTKNTGKDKEIFFSPYPNGPKCSSDFLTTHAISLNDENYQTDVNLTSTLDPETPDTPSGNGDVVLEIIVTAGTIDMNMSMSYHTH